MNRFQRRRALQKSPRSLFARRLRIILTKGLSRSLGYPSRTSRAHWDVQLELPLGLEDEQRRPGTKRGIARWTADRAVDKIRDRFGWEAVEYGSA